MTKEYPKHNIRLVFNAEEKTVRIKWDDEMFPGFHPWPNEGVLLHSEQECVDCPYIKLLTEDQIDQIFWFWTDINYPPEPPQPTEETK